MNFSMMHRSLPVIQTLRILHGWHYNILSEQEANKAHFRILQL
jgi:hypothetical protein